MEEIKEEVIAEAPPAETEAPVEQKQAPVEEVVESSETPEVKPEVIKDNRPIENVAWETKRKLDEIYPIINQLKDLPQLIQNQQAQQQQAKPTKEQLIYWKTLTSDPQELARIDIELEKQRDSELKTLIADSQKQSREQTLAETKKQQSYKWVEDNLPDVIVKNQMGQVVGWNDQSPLYRQIGVYMSDPRIANDPEGIKVAAKMAAFDLGITPIQNKKIDRTVAQLRKEQKKQLASAGGTRPAETPANATQAKYEKLKKTYAETGNREAFAEMLKMRGQNPFAT